MSFKLYYSDNKLEDCYSTELNDVRIIIVSENLTLLLKEVQFVMPLKIMEHGIHYLPCSYTNDVINMLP